MTQQTKSQTELREAAQKLLSYLDHCERGVAQFDANNAAINKAEDAIRVVKFQSRATSVIAEGPDALVV